MNQEIKEQIISKLEMLGRYENIQKIPVEHRIGYKAALFDILMEFNSL